MAEAIKVCSRCRQTLPVSQFHKNKAQSDGLANNCKTCVSVMAKRYYKKDPKARIAKSQEWKQQKLKELTQIFGEQCQLCGAIKTSYNMVYHEKHGSDHNYNLNNVLKHKENFVKLCRHCHMSIHHLAHNTDTSFAFQLINGIKKGRDQPIN